MKNKKYNTNNFTETFDLVFCISVLAYYSYSSQRIPTTIFEFLLYTFLFFMIFKKIRFLILNNKKSKDKKKYIRKKVKGVKIEYK